MPPPTVPAGPPQTFPAGPPQTFPGAPQAFPAAPPQAFPGAPPPGYPVYSRPSPPSPPHPGPAHGGVLLVRILGLGLTLVLVLLGGSSVAAEFFRQRTEASTTIAGTVDRVIATTDAGDIRIRSGEAGGPVVVRRVLSWTFSEPQVTLTHQGGTLNVGTRCRLGLSLTSCTADLELTVPAGASVVLRTSAGNLRVDDLTGDVSATSSAGDIDLDALGSATVSATSSAGDVRVSLRVPPTRVSARSSAGDVVVRVPPDGTTYRVNARTSAGERRVEVPTDPQATRSIDAITSLGSVVVTAGP